MPFTPKDWVDSPSTTTPISAAALEDLEGRVTDYAEVASPFHLGFGTPDEVIHPGTTPGFDYDPDNAGWSTSNLPFFKIARYGRLLVPHLIPHWTNTSGDLNDYGFYAHPVCLCPASWVAADADLAPEPEPRTPFEDLYVRGAQGNSPVIQQVPVRFRFSLGPDWAAGYPRAGLWLRYEEFDSSLFAGGNEADGLYWDFAYQPMIVLPPGAEV